MNSMTGYGRGEASASGRRCVVECASVNRKALEGACQLPRELAALVPTGGWLDLHPVLDLASMRPGDA